LPAQLDTNAGRQARNPFGVPPSGGLPVVGRPRRVNAELRAVELPGRSLKTLLAILAFVAATAVHAQTFETNYASLGQLIVTQFVTAPFPHPSRAEGHKYQDKFYSAAEHYADSTVAIFIPKDFRETGQIDFVVHFHGWNNTVAGTLSQFKLIEQLVASGKDAVLVVPEGPHDAPDSFGGKLEDPDGFKKFMDEVAATLRRQSALKKKDFTIGNIVLSGHSGGYHVMSAILDHGGVPAKVKEVWLFDALYGQTDKFLAWSDKEHGRLLNIYTDHGGTTNETERLMKLLKERGTPFLATEASNATTQELKTNTLIFLHTDMTHNDVLEKRKTFTQFLKTSCLGNKEVK
jgi:hypothetical protein